MSTGKRGPIKLSGLIATGKVVPAAAAAAAEDEEQVPQPGVASAPEVAPQEAPTPDAAGKEQASSTAAGADSAQPADAVRAAPAIAPTPRSAPPLALATTAGKDLRKIPWARIRQNRFAPRTIYTAQMVSDRAEDLRENGQNDPIHVIEDPEKPDYFIIGDGWTRCLSCAEHKIMDELLAEVHHGLSERDAAWLGYGQNEGRAGQTDFDRAMFYAKCLADGESPAEVARKAKVSKTLMTYYGAYAKLPDELVDIVRESPLKFGATVTYHLFRLYEKCGVRKAMSLATKFNDEEQTVRWFINESQRLLHPTKPASAQPLKHIRYSNGYYKQRDNGFEVSISVPPEKRDEFAEKLEALLDTVAVVAQAELPGVE